jgi:ribonuclease-3
MPDEDLLARLGLAGDLPHLEEALTHPSYSNEHRRGKRADAPVADNQRLEFLGDAVLGLCVSELLMRRYPDAHEGELSLMRASLVNAEALAAWARGLSLGPSLRLGRGADAAGERDQTNVLADALEAIVAAVYLDRGLDAARELSATIVASSLDRASGGRAFVRDAKSELQEVVQATGRSSPRYHLVRAEGPDHQREFVVRVEVDGETLAEGRGRSKKLAEQAAARAALDVEHRPASASSPPLSSL